MRRSFALFAVVLLALIAGAADSVAAETAPVLSRIVDSGTFRVGMSGDQPPFTVVSKDGKLIGYEVDLANLLARTINQHCLDGRAADVESGIKRVLFASALGCCHGRSIEPGAAFVKIFALYRC